MHKKHFGEYNAQILTFQMGLFRLRTVTVFNVLEYIPISKINSEESS